MNRTSMTTVAAALVGPADLDALCRDTIVPAARQRRLAEAIPHATMVMVEGDHAVCIGAPARFSAKLLEACLGTKASSD